MILSRSKRAEERDRGPRSAHFTSAMMDPTVAAPLWTAFVQ